MPYGLFLSEEAYNEAVADEMYNPTQFEVNQERYAGEMFGLDSGPYEDDEEEFGPWKPLGIQIKRDEPEDGFPF